MERCFVIQPFDRAKFDKRYVDIFKPAIEKAGYEPYRIDNDLSVRVPIDDIEKGISESDICFAEISIDNPNVWYELGFAVACGKDVIMVCSDERAGKFPFDIQHRHIITYQTSSSSDFAVLGDTITRKILAFRERAKTVKKLQSTPVLETEGLTSHQIALLILIMESQLTSDYGVAIHDLQNEMNKAGYTNIATTVGILTLTKNGMVETFKQSDDYSNNQEYAACRLTSLGQDWILSNQNLLQFRQPPGQTSPVDLTDDLPF
ncbi:nucleoside 2-deoxyribosyltransferase [Ferruginibacter sp. HRS2-29]|uniref:nucleoside 2-deoxyribosyltransferase n=1 Tax=Ferruginibacter sp. HRS2-29 TaxID=2487334 RepID=UPI0020CC82C6|nr:nucleoside 2-deoxyribosyltransferase [Ferruginibacter sp. HRS2-29]MCP9749786.1 hypothetical protein [Ferruginibacter sp. HRS2-29]